MIRYFSTRDEKAEKGVSSAAAIKRGIAPDGGLYSPDVIPEVTPDFIDSLKDLEYSARAAKILSLFLSDDYSGPEIEAFCGAAYSPEAFPDGAAPLKDIGDGKFVLELWHGPSCAFKDMALQLMPRLLSAAITKTGEKRDALILVATSGDTGKAALEGYRDIDRIKIEVFYPAEGVSMIQKLQMMTQAGSNVDVCGIRGNFDDAQNGVKSIFTDGDIAAELDRRGLFLSSANSINWGRLLPQVVYYFSAYADLLKQGAVSPGERIDFVVPTGNFGNIFSGYLAYRMGLPVGRLVCASNRNRVLTDFFSTGVYDKNRSFYTTSSPSMDILISSNLERLLAYSAGPVRTAGYMSELKKTGRYSVGESILGDIRDIFAGYCADDEETSAAIGRYWKERHYLADTHTAVALSCADRYISETGQERPCVVLSTASPFKFASSVYSSVTSFEAEPGYRALEMLSEATGIPVPARLSGIDRRAVRFPDVCDADGMRRRMLTFAG